MFWNSREWSLILLPANRLEFQNKRACSQVRKSQVVLVLRLKTISSLSDWLELHELFEPITELKPKVITITFGKEFEKTALPTSYELWDSGKTSELHV